MGVTATNLLGGAGELYHGVFGAVEPLDTVVGDALDDEVWTDFGGTDGIGALRKHIEDREGTAEHMIGRYKMEAGLAHDGL